MAKTSKQPIENAGAIIEKFGGIRPMAAKIDAPVTTVQGWKKRDVIPGTRRQQIIDAAQDNNIDLGNLDGHTNTAEATPSSALPKPSQKNLAKPRSAKKTPDVKPAIVPSNSTKNESASEETSSNDIRATQKTSQKITQNSTAQNNDGGTSGSHDKLMANIEKNNQKNMVTTIWLSVLVVLLGLAIALFFLWPLIRDDVQSVQADNAQIEEKIEQLETKIETTEKQAGMFERFVPADVKNQITALQDQTNNIKETVQTLSDQAGTITNDVLGADAGPLSNRLAVLETKIGMLSNAEGFDTLISRVQNLENSLAGQGQINDAVKELQNMMGQFQNRDDLTGSLENAQAGADGALGQTLEGVSGDDLKAAAMLLAFSKFRDTLNREEPFENDLQLLQNLVSEDNVELQSALQRLAPQADDGVLSPAGLSEELKTMTGEIVFSSLKGEDVSIKDQALTRFNSVFQIEKEGEPVLGTETQKTVAKAQKLLESGNVEDAVTTLQQLEGPAAQTAAPLIGKAEMTLLADNVKQMISQSIFKDVAALPQLNQSSATTDTAVPSPSSATIMERVGPVFDMDEVKRTLEETLPEIGQQDLVRDQESGLSILPPNGSNTQKFKGFSAGE